MGASERAMEAALAVDYDDSRLNVWETTFSSISHRFPGVTGKLLWTQIFGKHYVKTKNGKLRFFSKDGRKLLHRARSNDRDEDGTRAK